ncbi:MAG: hypothetical protein U9R08_03630 [Nanoarchaeota archaeon]|nr:hypothetical protein [Nanoarchaeota archaeon]
MRTGRTEGIIAVANHKLTLYGVEEYKKYLSHRWVSIESVLKFCKNAERDPEEILIQLLKKLKK